MLRRSGNLLIATFVAGLVLAGAGRGQAAVWATTSMPWFALPGDAPVGALPKTVAIPAKAWDYGARSDRLDVFGKNEPTILRVDIQVQSGSVGVVLMGVDGSTLLSKETTLKPADGATQLFFRVRPTTPPGFVILRNYDAPGVAGSIALKQVQFIREADLTNDELTAIVQRGLH